MRFLFVDWYMLITIYIFFNKMKIFEKNEIEFKYFLLIYWIASIEYWLLLKFEKFEIFHTFVKNLVWISLNVMRFWVFALL